MSKALFITATDTEVGKTFIAAGLCRAFRKNGLQVGCCKPIATGEAVSSDALKLKEASGSPDPVERINPVLFTHPIAPGSAAQLENRSVAIPKLLDHIKDIVHRNDITIIEGVGGVMVPIADNYLVIDLMADLGYEAMVISPARLGTINHTLLTTSALRQRNIPVNSIVFNLCWDTDIVTESSYQSIRQYSSVPVIAKISYNKIYQKNLDSLARDLDKQINCMELYRSLQNA